MGEAMDLLPCPFCGSPEVTVEKGRTCAWCGGCDAEGPVADHGDDPVALWNRRADLHTAALAEKEAEVERLRDALGAILATASVLTLEGIPLLKLDRRLAAAADTARAALCALAEPRDTTP